MIRLALALVLTLGLLMAAAQWLDPQGRVPAPAVRAEPSSRLAEIRDAASSWIAAATPELPLQAEPEFETSEPPRQAEPAPETPPSAQPEEPAATWTVPAPPEVTAPRSAARGAPVQVAESRYAEPAERVEVRAPRRPAGAGGAIESEWSDELNGATAGTPPEAGVDVAAELPAHADDAAPLGSFRTTDLDESDGIVRRLLAIYARIEATL